MLKNKKNIAVLGSTGSIGTQTISVISKTPSRFRAFLLSANTNYKLLFKQALELQPKHVFINSNKGYNFLLKNLPKSVSVHFKDDDLSDVLSEEAVDLVLIAIVGKAGLLPTIIAIKANKDIAIANKESLVIAGEIIMSLAKKHGVSVFPVDSEHSAIFQCLCGEHKKNIKKLILTASGGPFLNLPADRFNDISLEQALKHPNWSMGQKITIDSSTLMNKGFEIIEAFWLFSIPLEKIEVVIHPQSIIHSMVEFVDGSIKAQLGKPDMRLPIIYALSFPERYVFDSGSFSLTDLPGLSFFNPDFVKFPHLKVAYDCLRVGGTAPCALNAANEVAVDSFLEKKIKFVDMIKIVEKSIELTTFVANPKIDDHLRVDEQTRIIAKKLI
tara:strand:+ start:935 stop:2089 length:1155 start_codon:yes stop_codon:yes gene_type:complete